MIPRAHLLWAATLALFLGCDDGSGGDADGGPSRQAEKLEPAPPGAPADVAVGELACLGNFPIKPATGGALELTGYIRTLADPTAQQDPPAARVDAFDSGGMFLEKGFADPSKAGRVAISVPTTPAGFTGYAVVTQDPYLDWRLETSRPVTDSRLNGWAFLTTEDEVTERATELGLVQEPGNGILVGSVHDCEGIGVGNAVVQINGSLDGVIYVEGFDLTPARTFTSDTGRFALANVAPGEVTIKAFARLRPAGPLTLLSKTTATVEAGKMTSVDLQPREK